MNFRCRLRPEVLLCRLAVVYECLLNGSSETLNKENCRISVPDQNNIGQTLYNVCSLSEDETLYVQLQDQDLTGENSKAASINRYRFIEKGYTYLIQVRRDLQNSAQTVCKSNATTICFRKVGTDILITSFLSSNALMQLKPYGFQWRIYSKHSHGGRKQLKANIYFFCNEFKKSNVFALPRKPQRNLSLWFKGLCPCEKAQEHSVDDWTDSLSNITGSLSNMPPSKKSKVIIIVVVVMGLCLILLLIVHCCIESRDHCCLRQISPPPSDQQPESPQSSNQPAESPLLPNQSSESPSLSNQSSESPPPSDQPPESPQSSNQPTESPSLTDQPPESPPSTDQPPESTPSSNQSTEGTNSSTLSSSDSYHTASSGDNDEMDTAGRPAVA